MGAVALVGVVGGWGAVALVNSYSTTYFGARMSPLYLVDSVVWL